MPGSLRIQDRTFDVDEHRSEFFAYVPQEPPGQPSPGHLRWTLEVYCVDQEHERGLSSPYLTADRLILDVRDWMSVAGQTIRSAGGDELGASLYAAERGSTSDHSIRFVSCRANVFSLAWECRADAVWDDGTFRGSPVELRTEIAFQGIQIWWLKADPQGLAEAQELVGRHFDLACLEAPRAAGPYHIVFPPRSSVLSSGGFQPP